MDCLSRTVKEEKDRRDKTIFEMWMACYTQEEIAKTVGLNQTVVSDITKGFMETVLENQNHKAAASHAVDFEIPLYNVWKQQEKRTNGPQQRHFRPLAGR